MNKIISVLILLVLSFNFISGANYPVTWSLNSPSEVKASSPLPNCITDYQNSCIKCVEGYEPVNGVCQEDNCYVHDYYGACQSLRESQNGPNYNKIESRKNVDRSQTSNCLAEKNGNCINCREGYEPKEDLCIKSECWTHDYNGNCLTLEEYNKKINSPNRSSENVESKIIFTILSDYNLSGKVIFNNTNKITITDKDISKVLSDYGFPKEFTAKVISEIKLQSEGKRLETNNKDYFVENETAEIPLDNSITGNAVDDKQENIFNKFLNFFKNLF